MNPPFPSPRLRGEDQGEGLYPCTELSETPPHPHRIRRCDATSPRTRGEVEKRFVAAAEKMKRDGWWWHDASLTNKGIRRKILKEMLASRFGR